MNELAQLKQRVEQLERIINEFYRSDRYQFPRKIVLPNGVNIETGSSADEYGAGTVIGGSATSKIGFFGQTITSGQQQTPTIPSMISISGTGADANINTNFSALQAFTQDLSDILETYGLLRE